MHTRINSQGLFLVHKIDLRKARERELETLDEKSTSSRIAEPYARSKLKALTGGSRRDDTCDHRLSKKLESKKCKKKKGP